MFKYAVVWFVEVISESLTANGYTADDLALLVPHQANIRISDYVRQRINLPDEKPFGNIQ